MRASIYNYEGKEPTPRRSLAQTAIDTDCSTYIENEGDGRKSIRRQQSMSQAQALEEPTVEKDVEKEMDLLLVVGGDSHLTSAHASFGDKSGHRVPQPLGLAELKQHWAQIVKQRTAQAQSIDQELDNVEAELYGDVRDHRGWPKATVDPRTQENSWRDITWEPLTRSSGPPIAKDVVVGAKPWVPWGEEQLSLEESKPPMLMSSSLTHAGLSVVKPLPHISSKSPGPVPTAWPTVAEQWTVSLEKELAKDLAALEARREAERGGGQTLRRPRELMKPFEPEPHFMGLQI